MIQHEHLTHPVAHQGETGNRVGNVDARVTWCLLHEHTDRHAVFGASHQRAIGEQGSGIVAVAFLAVLERPRAVGAAAQRPYAYGSRRRCEC